MSITDAKAIRERYVKKSLDLLPPESAVLERNAVVTATYARWYLEHPTIFKWAGMATFASHRVGLALSPYEVIVDNGEVKSVVNAEGRVLSEVVGDVNLLRTTNNYVYEDIGWTHLAYVDPEGGLAVVKAGLADIADTHFRLIEGFEAIDRGRKLLEAGDAAGGAAAVWAGNKLLLQHEQYVTVQPAFDRFDRGFDLFVSAFTTLDFDANNLTFHLKNGTSFMLFMATFGHKMVPFGSLPNICKREQRWYWIEKRALPMWQGVDKSDAALKSNMEVLSKRRNWLEPPPEALPPPA